MVARRQPFGLLARLGRMMAVSTESGDRGSGVDRRLLDSAFGEFFASHYGPAFRLATLLEGDPSLGEDAVCEAFARMYGRVVRGGVGDVEPYLRQAVVNAVRGGWRKRQVERRHARTFVRNPEARDVEADVVQRDELWSALRRLPPGQRRIIVLRFYEDLPEAEVARLLQVTVGTVKSQAAKGLAALQTLLEVRDG
jgi:RNA polymerase sigma-70 factor (sigma-E family)